MFIIHIRRGERLGDRQRVGESDREMYGREGEEGREDGERREINIEDCEGEKEM